MTRTVFPIEVLEECLVPTNALCAASSKTVAFAQPNMVIWKQATTLGFVRQVEPDRFGRIRSSQEKIHAAFGLHEEHQVVADNGRTK